MTAIDEDFLDRISDAPQAHKPLALQAAEVNHSRLGHIPALDGVRGVAIILVLFNHFSPVAAYGNGMAKIVEPITKNMGVGVDLFFVLSGFLITGILLRSRSSKNYFRNFYTRRALRIFPLYYFVLILLAIGLHVIPSWEKLTTLRNAWPWYWFYGTNYLVCRTGFAWLDHSQVSLGHLWSLAVEEHFYLFWPLMVWFLSERGLVRLCIALIVIAPLCRAYAVLLGLDPHIPMVATQCRMDSLALGALLAVVIQHTSPAQLVSRFKWIGLFCAVAAVICFAMDGRVIDSIQLRKPVAIFSYTFVAFAWGVFLLSALSIGPLNRLMSQRWLGFFGVYSYGMYIYHRIILNTLTTWFSIRRLAWHGHIWTAILPHYILCFGATILIALASYHLFEKHFLKLKRWFE
jgi:peptidoglycan/LPS O-acetylase OafA/YrhL